MSVSIVSAKGMLNVVRSEISKQSEIGTVNSKLRVPRCNTKQPLWDSNISNMH